MGQEFDNMFDFSENNMRTWTMDYVNLNNNIFVTVGESHDDLIEVEKEFFKLRIKKEITIPLLWYFISD